MSAQDSRQTMTGAAHSQVDARSPLAPSVVRILDYRQETYDTFTITCEPPAGTGEPYRFQPGQFNMLYLLGLGEAPISMSGDCTQVSNIVHTIRSVGSVTTGLSRLRPGSALGLRGPYGVGWPLDVATGKDVVLVTGGIGLAPLRPVLYELVRRRPEFGRVCLLHGSRTPEDLIFVDELSAWARGNAIEVRTTVDHAGNSWNGNVGVVTTLFSQVEFDPVNAVAFLCGPEIMMRFAVRDLRKRRMRPDQLFVSLERNMQCAVGFCGHCQFGPHFLCMDGPVFRYDRIEHFFEIREA
jgi:NAD(P)H-flavin reductase